MVIDTISKGEVDGLAKSLLSYLSHYNQEAQVRPCGCSAGQGMDAAAALPRFSGGKGAAECGSCGVVPAWA